MRVQRYVDADAQQGSRAVALAPDVVEPALHGARTNDAVRETGTERVQVTIDVGEALLREAADGREG